MLSIFNRYILMTFLYLIGYGISSLILEPRNLLLSASAQSSSTFENGSRVYQGAIDAFVTIDANGSTGSGSIIDASGILVTNEHVIRDSFQGQVTVIDSDSQTYLGRVIAVDRMNDLALVRILSEDVDFPTIPLAEVSSIQVGQPVFAIGSPFGLAGTLTTGILSRVDASRNLLQTDASLNPGNSGGPLLNDKGELIGVNRAVFSAGGQLNTGIGFATSIISVQEIIQRSISVNIPETTTILSSSSRQLGINVDAASLIIQSVEPGSLAEAVGFRAGDRLIELNGMPVQQIEQVISVLNEAPLAVTITILRNRQISEVYVAF